jgi:hypothetical protein
MSPPLAPAPTPEPGLAARLLDAISSVWFGVTMLVVIFIYASLGSALPPIRQGAMADWTGFEFLRFEKSEMEWFSWWPFQLMLALFCVAMLLATFRRVRLTLPNVGIWMTHAGILLLVGSSAYYFGTKVEGDAVVFQSRALILAPGMTAPASMVVRPEASIATGTPQHPYRISVAQMNPDYEILTGEHKGARTQSIWFNVEGPDRAFTRVVLVGYPEYTEDVLAGGPGGMQRAIKATGQKLLDPNLQIQLDYDPATYFYHAQQPPVRSTGAIYARFSPTDEWTQLRYDGLPHYYERLTHRNELWPVPGEAFPPLRPLDLTAEKPAPAGEIGKLDVRITDYLPYASLEPRWVDGGDTLNPVARLLLTTREGQDSMELVAASPQRRMQRLQDGTRVEFAWATTFDERKQYLAAPQSRVVFRVASTKFEKSLDIAALMKGPVKVEGTDYQIEVRDIFPDGLTQDEEGGPALAVFHVIHDSASFNRLVVADEKGGGRDIDDTFRPLDNLVDADVKLAYLDPAPPRVRLVAGPDNEGIELAVTGRDSSFKRQPMKVGEPEPVGEGAIAVTELIPNARSEVRPTITPRSRREPMQNVGKMTSLVRVEINDGKGLVSAWLPFNTYAFEDDQRAEPNRFTWRPRAVTLSDGRKLWLMYSRWRDPLPSPVALDRFLLKTYPGGDRPSDFVSLLRFERNGDWSPIREVKSNQPKQHGNLWYFQSQWDPGTQAYTILGVGNRNGVGAMLAGVILSIAGMAWAFYVKPVIKRRRPGGDGDDSETATTDTASQPAKLNGAEVSHV